MPPRSEIEEISGVDCLITKTTNEFYASSINPSKYDLAEDFSGKGFLTGNWDNDDDTGPGRFFYSDIIMDYYSPTTYFPNWPENYNFPYPPTSITFRILINNKNRNILRTDRIPSSDGLDGESWSQINTEDNQIIFKINGLLQQNNNFRIYSIESSDFMVDGFVAGEIFRSYDCSRFRIQY